MPREKEHLAGQVGGIVVKGSLEDLGDQTLSFSSASSAGSTASSAGEYQASAVTGLESAGPDRHGIQTSVNHMEALAHVRARVCACVCGP